MLPADLDDEHRADLAHEHPNDLDSSPSSPSSGTPTYFDSRRRSKSASHQRSHTTTDGSRSSHLLARLVSREEEVREINAALVVTNERLEAETTRANAAERRALDYFHRLRIATENRERSDQESARLREELKLYKLQLENAQKEIFRAQDIIDQVASQRNEAEAEAARARTKARKLQEEKLVMLAREEGRRVGYHEGLSMGRRIGYDEGSGRRLTGPSGRLPYLPFSLGHHDGDENIPEPGEATSDEERNDPRSPVQLRSGASTRLQQMRSESVPPVRMFDTSLHAPPLPIRVHTPSHEHRTPSPSRGLDEPETIYPIPIRPSPIISNQPISVPIDDGWIPRADSRTSYIHMPSPHALRQPIPPSPSTVATEVQDSRATQQSEPTPVPPPVRSRDYAYQTTVPPPPIPRGHTPSIASRTSTHLSQYDIVNKRPGSALRNEIYVGRAGSGSQPSRESTSRNEHRDQDRRYSSKTEAESIADHWRGDDDASPPPPRNPPRSFTPSAVPHPHRPPNFYYRPREFVTPTPLEDVDDPRSRTPVPTEPSSARLRPPDDPASQPARIRSPLEHVRRRLRQPRPGSGSSSIPNIIVESPSEPETTMSPSVAIATQPELLSPEAANRPLPQDDQHQHQHQHRPSHSHSRSQSQSQSQPPSRHYHSSSDDAPQRSGTPHTPWPAGFIPYPPNGTTSSSSSSKRGGGLERDHRRANSHPTSAPNRDRNATPVQERPRPRTQGASTSTGRGGLGGTGTYEAAPLPPGVMYPMPPVRPQTSHRPHRDGDRDREWDQDRERERTRDAPRDLDWDRDRERLRDRDRDRERRQDSGRDYERERERDRYRDDPEDTGLDEELTRSPAPLQRPISLFDSDEA
ncbi:hypothetical protein OG21DRAFT_1483885 [Imleria badia]|nr:hypothetical protein OG21DRAFT_1483885 [Imleria badia]